ncbi:MAG TPA: molybdopterin-dependent oxidoreductase [Candidatus Acidoferrales bacterium]
MRKLRLFTISLATLLFSTILPAARTLQDSRLSQESQPAQELKLVVAGDVPTPLTLTAHDLAGMPREKVEMPDPDGGKTTYEGVPLQEILKKAGIPFDRQMRGKDLAGYVLASAKDDYEVVFSLGELDPELGGTRVIVADMRDGKPLFQYQGPCRLVLPGDKAGARSVRMLEKLEVVKLRK